MRFVKMHGIGNDYIYLDAYGEPGLAERADLPELARAMSDRHTGAGSDGLILVCRPRGEADVRMRMFNADGSESEMCGNGVRCVAKFAHDRLAIYSRPMRVETGRGTLHIDYTTSGGKLDQATVDMGEPITELERIPVDASQLTREGAHTYGVQLPGSRWLATFISMGNPHAVVFQQGREELTLDQLRKLELDRLGPGFEHHSAFPRRINIHFVSVQGRGEATMRTWERGSGITQACGTGACAVLAAGVLTGRLDREALLHLPGGDLRIAWERSSGGSVEARRGAEGASGVGHISMTGPATEVFTGEWPQGDGPEGD